MTEVSIFKIVYGICWAFIVIIRIGYTRQARTNQIVVDRQPAREKFLLAVLSIGTLVFPLVYVFTPWLSFADYRLPGWAGCAGAAVFAVGLWLLWRSHAALGRNWSRSLQLRQGHELVTSGVYRRIRHPMYAFGWLMGIAQALLLWNWIVGVAGLATFGLLYFQRVSREEQLMLDQFGEEYRAYMNRTGRIVPRLKYR